MRAPLLSVRCGAQLLLEVDAGEAVALSGEVQRVVDALTGPGEGQVSLGERDLRGRLAARVRGGLGVVAAAPVAADVTVRDHLAARTGSATAERLLEGAPLLQGRGGDRAGVLSGGERTVLAWLRCLASEPCAVLLDHAAAGLDLPTVAWARRVVATWRERGVAVVIVPGRPEERAWADREVVVPPP